MYKHETENQQSKWVTPNVAREIHYWQDDDRYNINVIGDIRYPQSLIAIKQDKDIACIRDRLVIIYACEDVVESQKQIELYRQKNKNLPSVMIKQPKLVKQIIQKDKSVVSTFEIWFKSEKVLDQLLEDKQLPSQQIRFIYFNSSDKQAYSSFRDRKCVVYGTKDILQLFESYFKCVAINNFILVEQLTEHARLDRSIVKSMIHMEPNTALDLERFVILVLESWRNRAVQKQQIRQLQYNFRTHNILTLYSQDTFLYKFVNHFMKVAKDPRDIYYIQKIVKEMSNEVTRLYEKQKNNQHITKIFYRGALLHVQEIKLFEQSIGKAIQNFGFLSTSLDEKVALNFVRNVLFVITVQNVERIGDNGFAHIQEFAALKKQLECIFNPFCDFIIQKVSKIKIDTNSEKKDYYEIRLTYGKLGEAAYKKYKNIPLSEQEARRWVLWKFIEVNDIKYQSDLYLESDHHKNRIVFYKKASAKYSEKERQSPQHVFVQKQLVASYIAAKQFTLARTQLQQLESIEEDVEVIKMRGDILEAEGKLEQAVNAYQQIAYSNLRYSTSMLDQFNLDGIDMDSRAEMQREEDCFAMQVYFSYSQVLHKLGNFTPARLNSLEAIGRGKRHFHHKNITFCLRILDHVLKYQQQRYRKCQKLLQHMLPIVKQLNSKTPQAYILTHLLLADVRISDESQANQHVRITRYQQALKIWKECQLLHNIVHQYLTRTDNGKIFHLRGILANKLSEYTKALDNFSKAHKNLNKVNARVQNLTIIQQIVSVLKSIQSILHNDMKQLERKQRILQVQVKLKQLDSSAQQVRSLVDQFSLGQKTFASLIKLQQQTDKQLIDLISSVKGCNRNIYAIYDYSNLYSQIQKLIHPIDLSHASSIVLINRVQSLLEFLDNKTYQAIKLLEGIQKSEQFTKVSEQQRQQTQRTYEYLVKIAHSKK